MVRKQSKKSTGACEVLTVAPAPPKDLTNKDAREEWRRMAPLLIAEGRLTAGDLSAFEGYCRAWGTLADASRALDKAGSLTFETATGYIRERPEVGIALRAGKEVRAFFKLFGLSPVDRKQLGAQAAGHIADPMDAFD